MGINEPFLPAELEDATGPEHDEYEMYRWHAKALTILAEQLGVWNDFYFPLLGAAQLLDDETARARMKEWKK